MKTVHHLAIVAVTLVLAACQDHKPSTAEPASTPADHTPANSRSPAINAPTDAWLGKWTGPEGTYLLLSRTGNKYEVTIRSLDGLDIYEGIPAGDRIQFERNGKTESVHAGNGKKTGMKWLLDKKNCLMVKLGEGFCRE